MRKSKHRRVAPFDPSKDRVLVSNPLTGELDQWVQLIGAALQKGIDCPFEVGELLVAAKAAVKHGQWEALVDRLPLGRTTETRLRYAQYDKAIAGDARLQALRRDPNKCSFLPLSVRTLHELHKLKDDELKAVVARGQHDLTANEVRSMKRYAPMASSSTPAPTPARRPVGVTRAETAEYAASFADADAHARGIRRDIRETVTADRAEKLARTIGEPSSPSAPINAVSDEQLRRKLVEVLTMLERIQGLAAAMLSEGKDSGKLDWSKTQDAFQKIEAMADQARQIGEGKGYPSHCARRMRMRDAKPRASGSLGLGTPSVGSKADRYLEEQAEKLSPDGSEGKTKY